MRTDVSKEAEVQALAEQTIDRFGAVHVVCNNAGVAARSDPWFGPLSAWHWVMGVNFWGVVHGCRAFLPHLVGGGHIVEHRVGSGADARLRAVVRRLQARRRWRSARASTKPSRWPACRSA